MTATAWLCSSDTEAMQSNIENIVSATAMQIRFILRAAKLKKMADSSLRKAQRRYRQDHDKKFHFEPTFAPRDYVLVECPPVFTTAAK